MGNWGRRGRSTIEYCTTGGSSPVFVCPVFGAGAGAEWQLRPELRYGGDRATRVAYFGSGLLGEPLLLSAGLSMPSHSGTVLERGERQYWKGDIGVFVLQASILLASCTQALFSCPYYACKSDNNTSTWRCSSAEPKLAFVRLSPTWRSCCETHHTPGAPVQCASEILQWPNRAGILRFRPRHTLCSLNTGRVV